LHSILHQPALWCRGAADGSGAGSAKGSSPRRQWRLHQL